MLVAAIALLPGLGAIGFALATVGAYALHVVLEGALVLKYVISDSDGAHANAA
jgi:hypothetical protein